MPGTSSKSDTTVLLVPVGNTTVRTALVVVSLVASTIQ